MRHRGGSVRLQYGRLPKRLTSLGDTNLWRHEIVRMDRALVITWSDADVSRRWLRKYLSDGMPMLTSERKIADMAQDTALITKWRLRGAAGIYPLRKVLGICVHS